MNPKLTERDVLRMRHLHYDRGWTYRLLAKRYGVGVRAAIRAVTGKSWAEAGKGRGKLSPRPDPAPTLPEAWGRL